MKKLFSLILVLGLVWGSNIFADDSLEMLKKKLPGLGSVPSAQKNNNEND